MQHFYDSRCNNWAININWSNLNKEGFVDSVILGNRMQLDAGLVNVVSNGKIKKFSLSPALVMKVAGQKNIGHWFVRTDIRSMKLCSDALELYKGLPQWIQHRKAMAEHSRLWVEYFLLGNHSYVGLLSFSLTLAVPAFQTSARPQVGSIGPQQFMAGFSP